MLLKEIPGSSGLEHLIVLESKNELKTDGRMTKSHIINQIPYNYAVKVTNRFKGLDLINRVPEELWMEIRDIVQEAVIKTIPKKKKSKKAKWLSEEAF